MSAEVVVYTMKGCPACAGVKEYLKGKGVEFTEKDVLEGEGVMDEFRAKGFRSTPMTIVGDTEILGLDKPKIDEALAALE